MEPAIEKVLNLVHPKVKALLRTRHIYCLSDILQQFKAHIWGYFEYISGSVNHAMDSLLNKFDQVQNSFLRELGLSPEMAFLEYKFAPVTLRRDIGLLGFVHKCVVGNSHYGVKGLLPMRE